MLLTIVTVLVTRTTSSGNAVRQSVSAQAVTTAATSPLDQLSSADIAVQVARITNLYEVASVTNNAQSLNAQIAVASADQTIVAKPQIAATDTKTKRDIARYVTVAGDTVSGLARRFGITSDSIRWSNALGSSDNLAVDKELFIPPLNGIVYTVKDGDTPGTLASKYRTNKDQITKFNDAEVSGLKLGEQILIPDGNIQPVVAYQAFPFGYAAVYGFNGYDYGWCTWYVANRRSDIGRPVPSNLGNAYSWYVLAQRAGLPTGASPAVGAVAVNQGGNHVSVVEQVNPDGSFWVSEMNAGGQVSIADSTPAGGWGRVDYKLYGSVGNLKFIY